jgi:hypothetical protein
LEMTRSRSTCSEVLQSKRASVTPDPVTAKLPKGAAHTELSNRCSREMGRGPTPVNARGSGGGAWGL